MKYKTQDCEDEVLERAFELWCKRFPGRSFEEELNKISRCKMQAVDFADFSKQQGFDLQNSWLRKMRLSLQWPMERIAEQLGVFRSTYARYEIAEANGNIRLKTLAKVADAMGCELVYGLRPRKEKPSMRMWRILHRDYRFVVNNTRKAWRAGKMASLMRYKMQSTKFRLKEGLSKRRP